MISLFITYNFLNFDKLPRAQALKCNSIYNLSSCNKIGRQFKPVKQLKNINLARGVIYIYHQMNFMTFHVQVNFSRIIWQLIFSIIIMYTLFFIIFTLNQDLKNLCHFFQRVLKILWNFCMSCKLIAESFNYLCLRQAEILLHVKQW